MEEKKNTFHVYYKIEISIKHCEDIVSIFYVLKRKKSFRDNIISIDEE